MIYHVPVNTILTNNAVILFSMTQIRETRKFYLCFIHSINVIKNLYYHIKLNYDIIISLKLHILSYQIIILLYQKFTLSYYHCINCI